LYDVSNGTNTTRFLFPACIDILSFLFVLVFWFGSYTCHVTSTV
jgi:hypothetical protein